MSSAFIDKIWVWASGKGESTFYNLHGKYAEEIIIQDFIFIFLAELIIMVLVLHQKKQSVVDTASPIL